MMLVLSTGEGRRRRSERDWGGGRRGDDEATGNSGKAGVRRGAGSWLGSTCAGVCAAERLSVDPSHHTMWHAVGRHVSESGAQDKRCRLDKGQVLTTFVLCGTSVISMCVYGNVFYAALCVL